MGVVGRSKLQRRHQQLRRLRQLVQVISFVSFVALITYGMQASAGLSRVRLDPLGF